METLRKKNPGHTTGRGDLYFFIMKTVSPDRKQSPNWPLSKKEPGSL
jgi:hypothetical protein